jgi:non-canonical (house-cleaning) NTP pyrophosphatase
MKLILNSTNEAKIETLKNAAGRFYNDFRIGSVEVEAPDQPISVEEAMNGAKSRARQAYSSDNSLGVGIEGYVEGFDGKMFLCIWCIYD